MPSISRKEFFEKNGFKMTNPQWAWSGVNDEKELVIFNAWEHFKEKKIDPNGKTHHRHIVFCDAWKDATASNTGFNDSQKNINLVMHGML